MAIGIYKPGQGYWVRVLTATLIGVITLAAAGWIYAQMGLVADKLPRSVWAMSFAQAGANPTPGAPITLIGKPTPEATAPGNQRSLRQADRRQQRDLAGQRAPHPPQGRRVLQALRRR